jgi:acetylornithine deacetylase
MSIDRDALVSLLQNLVRIDSRNPGLDPDGPGELEIARFVSGLLDSWGWDAELHDLGACRANVVARRPGAGGGPSLMINVHLDTVGVGGMAAPFSGDHRDGKVFGRGAQDTKGGMAAVLAVAQSVAEEDLRLDGDLVLAFVADEEHESIGSAALLETVRTDAAIVIEPSDLDVVIGHRGFGIFRVGTRGRMAHGGRPDLGVDANLHMGQVLVELDRLRREWSTAQVHPALGPASLHVPVLTGGRHLFVYADACHADVECRSIPGQTRDEVHADLQTALDRARERVVELEATIEPVLWRPPYEIDPHAPLVRTALAAVEEVTGRPGRRQHHGWWEDSGLLGEVGTEAVILGPTGGGLHTEEEWVDVDSVVHLAGILRRIALEHGGRRDA